jgi:hypothetical protein
VIRKSRSRNKGESKGKRGDAEGTEDATESKSFERKGREVEKESFAKEDREKLRN